MISSTQVGARVPAPAEAVLPPTFPCDHVPQAAAAATAFLSRSSLTLLPPLASITPATPAT